MQIVTVQDTFLDVIQDASSGKTQLEAIWIARRDTENEDHQEYYEVTVLLKKGELVFTGKAEQTHKISFSKTDSFNYTLMIEDERGRHSYTLVFPESKLDLGIRGSKVSTSAISPDGTTLIAGTNTGNILQYNIKSKLLVREFKHAHLADVLKLTILPSSQVMMSVGLDLQVKLWNMSADPSSLPVRVFSKQKSHITDIVTIDRGRNFLTASLDGSVVLWECSSAQIVSRFRRIDNLNDPATCMALAVGTSVASEDSVNRDLLFGCQDKYVFVGYELGVIQQYSVAGHFQTGPKLQRPCAVTSICVEDSYLVAGYADGLLRIYDITAQDKTGKGSEDIMVPYWDMQLNPNFPVEQLVILRITNDNELSVVASNGPELLLRVQFKDQGFECSQLVGLSEMFRIVLADKSSDSVFVATESEIVQFQV